MRIVRDSAFVLRWVSLTFVAAAIVLTMIQLVSYSRQRGNYPAGMTIAGVPVGGADPQTAAQRLLQVYNSTPIDIQYVGADIHMDPAVAGFQIDTESMLAAADLQRTGSSFWLGFWDFLWNRQTATTDVPLLYTLSEDRLRQYLKDEITTRYDVAAIPAQPATGQFLYKAGVAGQQLNIDHAVALIEDALKSASNRTVALTFDRTTPGRPGLQTLEGVIEKAIIDKTPFDGVVGFYLQDLQTGQEVHFGYDQNQVIPVEPDIAFTGFATTKISILVSAYKNLGPNLDAATQALIQSMMTRSENTASDSLMQKIDPKRGPLAVTDTMKSLGLNSTFVASYFNTGSLITQVFKTAANQRTDVVTHPDASAQTTPSEMGALLVDLYQCAQDGGGALVAAFPDKMNQAVCAQMLNDLKLDNIKVLIDAGLPEGTQIARKQGWITGESGIIQNISDAAIVYTPGGNYVLVIYVYHPVQALWEPVSGMFAKISQTVYEYYNLPSQ